MFRFCLLTILFVLSSFFNSVYAEIFYVELLKIKITSTKQLDPELDVYSCRGNIYRKKVSSTGKTFRQKTLSHVYLGELKEMRKIARLGWYIPGATNLAQREHFRWGKIRTIGAKYYTPYRGVRRYKDEEDDEDDGDDEDDEDDEDDDDSYGDDDDDSYGDDDNGYGSYDNDYDRDNRDRDDYDDDDEGDADDWLKLYRKKQRQAKRKKSRSKKSRKKYKNILLGSIDQIRSRIRSLAKTLSYRDSLSSRLRIFAKIFPKDKEGMIELAEHAARTLRRVSPSQRRAFYKTAVEYSIRSGKTIALPQFLKGLQLDRKRSHVKTYSHGKYLGQLRRGKKHGYGMYTDNRGRVYKGQWKNDKRHGLGTFAWADGTQYMGEWKNGRKHGYGILVQSDGYIFRKGYWNYNKYIGKYPEEEDEDDDY